jgi:hypothetical protein
MLLVLTGRLFAPSISSSSSFFSSFVWCCCCLISYSLAMEWGGRLAGAHTRKKGKKETGEEKNDGETQEKYVHKPKELNTRQRTGTYIYISSSPRNKIVLGHWRTEPYGPHSETTTAKERKTQKMVYRLRGRSTWSPSRRLLRSHIHNTHKSSPMFYSDNVTLWEFDNTGPPHTARVVPSYSGLQGGNMYR